MKFRVSLRYFVNDCSSLPTSQVFVIYEIKLRSYMYRRHTGRWHGGNPLKKRKCSSSQVTGDLPVFKDKEYICTPKYN